jgi:hypothetical protein
MMQSKSSFQDLSLHLQKFKTDLSGDTTVVRGVSIISEESKTFTVFQFFHISVSQDGKWHNV